MGSMTDESGAKLSTLNDVTHVNETDHPVGTTMTVKSPGYDFGRNHKVEVMRWGKMAGNRSKWEVRLKFLETGADIWVNSISFFVIEVHEKTKETLNDLRDKLVYANKDDHPVGTKMIVAYHVVAGISPERDVTVEAWDEAGDNVELQVNVSGGVRAWHEKGHVLVLTVHKDGDERMIPTYPQHDVGTDFLVEAVYEGVRLGPVRVIVNDWIFTAAGGRHIWDQVLLVSASGSPLLPTGNQSSKLWFKVEDVTILEIYQAEGKVEDRSFHPTIQNCPTRSRITFTMAGSDQVTQGLVTSWYRHEENLEINLSGTNKFISPKVKDVHLLSVTLPDQDDQENVAGWNDPPGQKSTNNDFFYHFNELKRIGEEQGFTVSLTMV